MPEKRDVSPEAAKASAEKLAALREAAARRSALPTTDRPKAERPGDDAADPVRPADDAPRPDQARDPSPSEPHQAPPKPWRPAFPDCHDDFCEPPSAPSELVPRPIGAVTSSVRFASFIEELALDGVRLAINGSCVSVPMHIKTFGAIFDGVPCPIVRLGYIGGHIQTWTSQGTALGEVVHSLSLAPGESRNVAMIDWRRRQATARGETTETGERLIHREDHGRALSEVARAVAMEQQFGQTMTAANTMATAGAFVAAGAVVGGIAGGLIGTAIEPGGGTLIGAGVGGAAGVAAGGLVFSGANAIGMIRSESSGDREVMARTAQEINQSTRQQSTAIRSLWSTVVVEDAQDEAIGVRSTNVTNYNHMHALNIQYYEVLHHYLVRTELDAVEPILMIPFAGLIGFDRALATMYWPALRVGFGEPWPERGNQVFLAAPPAEPTAPEGERPDRPEGLENYILDNVSALLEIPVDGDLLSMLEKAIKTTFQVGTLTAEILDDLLTRAELEIEVTDGPAVKIVGQRHPLPDLASTIAAFFAATLGIDVPVTGILFNFNASGLGIRADRINRIRLTLSKAPILSFDEQLLRTLLGDGINYEFKLLTASIDHPTDGFVQTMPIDVESELIYDEPGKSRDSRSWSPLASRFPQKQAEWQAFTEANGPWIAYDTATAEYERRVAELAEWEAEIIYRLNSEAEHFTRILLANSPGVLSRILDAARLVPIGATEPSRPLHQVADTTPIGVTDQAVVLKMRIMPGVSASALTDERLEAILDSLGVDGDAPRDLGIVLLHPYRLRQRFGDLRKGLYDETRVYLPGQGLFGEAVLGRSNGAEYINMRRFWNWQDSPIPHQAPTIMPLAATSFAQAPLATDPTVPAATLTQATPPSFPEPTGMAGILQAIQNGQMFRDMSKSDQLVSVIGGLSELAAKMGESAATMTGDAAEATLSKAAEIGKTAASLAETFAKNADKLGATPPPQTATEKAGAAELGAGNVPPGPDAPDKVSNTVNEALGLPPTSGSGGSAPAGGGSGGSGAGGASPGSVGVATGPSVWKDWAISGMQTAVAQAEANGTAPDLRSYLNKWMDEGLAPRLTKAAQNHHDALPATSEFIDWYEVVLTWHDDDANLEAQASAALDDLVYPALISAYDSVNDNLAQSQNLAGDLAWIDDLLSTHAMLGGEGHAELNARAVVTDAKISPDPLAPGDNATLTCRVGLQIGDAPPVYGNRFWVTARSVEMESRTRQGETSAEGWFTASIRMSTNRRIVAPGLAEQSDPTRPNDMVVHLSAAASTLPLVSGVGEAAADGALEVKFLGHQGLDASELTTGPYFYNGDMEWVQFRVFKGLLPLALHPVEVAIQGTGSVAEASVTTDTEGVFGFEYTPPADGEGTDRFVIEIAAGNVSLTHEFEAHYAAY